jgi:23S rRNA pseudouridine1911/1915/1917 synthase
MDMPVPWLEITAKDDREEIRLDAWVHSKVEGFSRRRLAAMIDRGDITVDGRCSKKNRVVRAGERIEIWTAPTPDMWSALPCPEIDLDIVALDDLFVVVNKPPGIHTVPNSPSEPGTLAGAIAARFPECAPLGRTPGNSGLLQRLDLRTSGLLVAARTPDSFESLWRAQREEEMVKTYVAVVGAGTTPLPSVINEPLSPAGDKGKLMVTGRGGTAAITRLEIRAARGRFLLVEATITKGARHQIRAHLAHSGHPIVGDELYGGQSIEGADRHLLHCAGLTFPHPDGTTGEIKHKENFSYEFDFWG